MRKSFTPKSKSGNSKSQSIAIMEACIMKNTKQSSALRARYMEEIYARIEDLCIEEMKVLLSVMRNMR